MIGRDASLGQLPGPPGELVECLPSLRVFLVVADAPSMAAGGRMLYKSTAAVSRAVGELESAIGTAVLERNSRGIAVTDAGQVVLSRARRIAAEVKQAATQLERARGRTGPGTSGFASDQLFDGRRLALITRLVATGSVSLAATESGMTQAGASMALSRIETGLGLSLFHRVPHGIIPTQAAQQLTMHTRRIFSELRALASDIASQAGATAGSVVIGTLPLGRTHVVPTSMADAVAEHPGLHITTVESHFDELVAGLGSGDIDIVVGVPRPSSFQAGLSIEPLFDDRLAVLAHADHPFTRRGRLGPANLVDQRWVLPWNASPSRQLLDASFEAAGLTPPAPAIESADLAIVRQILTSSQTLALASARQFAVELASGALVELDVDLPPMIRRVALLMRDGAKPSPATCALIDALRARSRQEKADSPLSDSREDRAQRDAV